MRIGKIGFLRFAARKPARSNRVAQAETLQQLGIVVEFAALPQAHIEEQAVAPGRLGLR